MLFSEFYYEDKAYNHFLQFTEEWGTFEMFRPFLCEVTSAELKRSTEKFQRVMKARANMEENGKRNNDVLELKITPFAGVKTILFNAVVESSGQSPNTPDSYKTVMSFSKVEFVDKNKRGSIAPKVTYKGTDYFFKKLSMDKNDVLVRCGCPDFYWRFSDQLQSKKALVRIPKFPKKIIKGVRPPVNPKDIPGICRHLYSLISHLRAEGYLR